jgi:hypothetical protein
MSIPRADRSPETTVRRSRPPSRRRAASSPPSPPPGLDAHGAPASASLDVRVLRRRPAPRSSIHTRTRQSASQDLRENDRVVVILVVCGVDERERALSRPAPELGDARTLMAELGRVAPAELREAARLMPEPSPQLRARRQLSVPLVESCPLARDPARPKPIDQHAIAVRGRGGVVDALQANVHQRLAAPTGAATSPVWLAALQARICRSSGHGARLRPAWPCS